MRRARSTEYGWHWRGRVFRPLFRRAFRDRRGVGRWGEWLALRHLRRLGWDVLARNWTARRGEVDLIACHGETVVFVEVKTLLDPKSGARPEDQLSRQKIARLEDLALDFLRRYELLEAPLRLDLVAIETPDLRRFDLRHYIL